MMKVFGNDGDKLLRIFWCWVSKSASGAASAEAACAESGWGLRAVVWQLTHLWRPLSCAEEEVRWTVTPGARLC